MNTFKNLARFVPVLLLSLVISCSNSLSKEQKRNINNLKNFIQENPEQINSSHEQFGIPINYAVLNNYPFLLEWVIRQKADVNIKDQKGETPLHRSIIWDHTKNQQTKRILIENGADVNKTDNYGNTALHITASLGKVSIAKLLIVNGATVNPRAQRGETPIHYAARKSFNRDQNHIDTVRLLLKSGSNVDEKDDYGRTGLHLSAFIGNNEMTEFLLQQGANPNSLTAHGDSPLHIAAASGQTNVAELLLKYDAKINQKNKKGLTPLNKALYFPATHYQAQMKKSVDTKEVVKLLRKYGGIE